MIMDFKGYREILLFMHGLGNTIEHFNMSYIYHKFYRISIFMTYNH